ncbi:bacteriohopanetetrol glucosamine biosynthesis glycosyltransferase HpnI [Dongia soli]|uniref:Bacteriohopanetetrol glucosamine biosynthesis glycosyltransferase HpnI n=1 Tax=Dongia soli TaxID=600628 RepID=A0ABU5E7D9_9PROT|nr:bacteriohopanetetrol glucosamine biosynthesis glycosyltransferase HpnI [Dongia soli]MDY0882210.1 bacteriohopanetetrol glucosamine biosynthesis glycosyltransferase HpnI [Dongia soli]
MQIDSDLVAMIITNVGWACFIIAGVGSIYTLAAAILVRRFFRHEIADPQEFPPVSILKPLHGDEFGLAKNLEALCLLDYPGPFQIVFGVQDPYDPAIQHVENLRRAFPHIDICLVVDVREHGANRKVSNLINLMREVRHDLLVLADSDIGIDRAYLRQIVAELVKPEIGLVTCLYRGRPTTGLWPRLSAMAIEYSFMPSVVLGLSIGLARPCFGSTMVLRRAVLQEIGGFEAFADHLADDNAIGEAVRHRGYKVSIPPMAVTHLCSEQSLRELLIHEMRWARTIRAIAGRGFAGTIITHPFPFALLGAAAMGLSVPTAGAVAAVLGCRLILGRLVDEALGGKTAGWWLMPVRDMLSFAVFCASFFVGSVTWRGRRFHVRADGMLLPVEEH